MARELRIVISAETYEAEAKLRVLEAQITQLNKDVEKGAITWDEYEKQLKATSTAAAAQRQNLDETRKTLEKTTQTVSPLTTMIMRYASGAVIGAALKGTAAWASNLEDLSAKSSISVTQLQKLEVVAGRSGGSLEQIATAASMLLDKLGSNDKALIKAVSTLGLNLDKLRTQDPGQTFIDLATAIAKVEDPAKRMALAVDIFGRQGRQLMPTILEIGKGIEGIGGAAPETIARLDQLDDALRDLWRAGKVLLAEIFLPMVPVLNAVADAAIWTAQQVAKVIQTFGAIPWLKQALDQVDTLVRTPRAPAAPAGPGLPGGGGLDMNTTGGFEAIFNLAGSFQSVKDLTAAHKDAAKAAKELAQAHENTRRRLELLAPVMPAQWALPEPTFSVGGPKAGDPWASLFGGTGGGTNTWFQTGTGILPSRAIWPGLITSPTATGTPFKPGTSFLQAGFGGVKGLSGGLSNAVLGSVMGGGNVGQAIGGFAGSGIMQGVVGKFSESFGKSFLGQALGGILPGIGALLGPLLGKLFGPSEATKTRQARGQFISQFGGLEELRAQADLAHFSLDRLLSTKKTKTLEAEIQKLNAAMEATKKRVAAITQELDTLNASGGLVSQGLLKKIQYDLKNPEVQQAVFQFMQQQAQTALTALEAYVTKVQIRTTGGARALAASAVAVFEELQRQGMSAVEALAAMTPALDALGTQLDRLGGGGGEAFDTLRRLAGIASDEIRGPLIQSIDDLTRLMTSLGNLGLITQDIFSGLTQEITATYERLLDLGTDSSDALLLLQAPLQRLYELQQRFGFTIDDATQALLDQAKAAGLVGDQFKSAEERMIDAINQLIARFDVLLEKVYGIVPAANAAANAVRNIRTDENTGQDYWTGKRVDPEAMPEYQHGSGGLRDFGRETVARLHGREAVVTEAQWRAMTGGGITVTIDARGALLGDPASQAALARLVSDALWAQQSLRTPGGAV